MVIESIDTWTAVALAVFSFVLGVRICWLWTMELRGLKKAQQAQIDAVTAKVQWLLSNKRVKRITIKREKKTK
jgi:hypothetical protein